MIANRVSTNGCASDFRASTLAATVKTPRMPTGLSRWRFTIAATKICKRLARCHGLAPWRLTCLLAWPQGYSAISCERETSRGKPRGILGPPSRPYVAGNVNLQRDKPVASSESSHSLGRARFSRASNSRRTQFATEGKHEASLGKRNRHDSEESARPVGGNRLVQAESSHLNDDRIRSEALNERAAPQGNRAASRCVDQNLLELGAR